jgi:trehalose 6-phosphate phosphatase
MAGGGRSRRRPPSPAVRRALAPLLVDPATTAIVSDFDGTLSPIVDRPAEAGPLEGAVGVLALLARRFRLVAVVSGRPASFLVEHLADSGAGASSDAPSPHFVGLYGLEVATGDGRTVPEPEAARWRPVIDEVVGRLRSGAPPGALVEAKGLAVTVHWRTAPDAESWASAAVAAESEATGLRSHRGRMSLELRPPLAIDKGSVVRRLLHGCTAGCYLGDDLGDLPAFAALADASAEDGTATVAIAVADDESPPEVLEAADVVLRGPDQALAALEWLARSGLEE